MLKYKETQTKNPKRAPEVSAGPATTMTEESVE